MEEVKEEEEALECGVDMVLLDNFSPKEVRLVEKNVIVVGLVVGRLTTLPTALKGYMRRSSLLYYILIAIPSFLPNI